MDEDHPGDAGVSGQGEEFPDFGGVTVTRSNFVELVLAELPEVRPVVAEHLDDQFGELLLHMLVADIRRFLLTALDAGDREVVVSGLAFLRLALANGDADVDNAVAVSFVEDSWDTPTDFIALWPAALLDERDRQGAWHPKRGPLSSS